MSQPPPHKALITLAVMIPTLIEILDTSVANVSLTHIQGSLAAGQEEVTWVLTSYLVANAIVIPMSGWLARLMGRKRYLLLSLVVFTISSGLCGAATSLNEIIIFRIMQGMGGGALQPMSQAILLETYPPNQRGLAMGIFGMGIVVGPILGPLVGGYLTDNYSWRWIFYINVPIGALAFYMITSFVFDPEFQERREKGEKVDYIGLMLLAIGLGSLQIVLDKGELKNWFGSNQIVILTILAIVALTALVIWELYCERPIVDLRIFKDRSFATANIVVFLAFFAFFGSIVLLPLFLQTLMGYTAYLAGWVLGPGGAISFVMLPFVGKMTEKIDARILLAVGLLINAYSVDYMSGLTLEINIETATFSRVIQGVGMPFIFVPCSFLAMAYVPKEKLNNASAIFNLLRNLGSSFGVAFVSTLLDRRAQFHQARLAENFYPSNPLFSNQVNQLQSVLQEKLGSFSDLS
ncbi:MAG: DHA2 family efflux MFS transporter permease subunit, partial [Desulfomonilaceae bacterium]